MSIDESNIWDKKYADKKEYSTLEDFFGFTRQNPTVNMVSEYLFPEAKVLELGSGTGEIISFLSSNYKIRAFGVDYSPESIKISNNLKNKFGLKVTFQKEDATKLSFADASFDVVYGDQFIGHVENTQGVFLEVMRLLKPNGVFILTSPNKLRFDGWDFYKKFSDNHLGFRQNSFYPWSLIYLLKNSGFNFIEGYGDMLFLKRSFDVLRKRFQKNNTKPGPKVSVSVVGGLTDKRKILKNVYRALERICPWWLKVSIGIIVKK